MPSKKRKYNARFPAGRIKKIMQTDEEVGKVAQAVPIIISRTLELFVESLLSKAMQVTMARNAKTLSPSHVKQCILAESRFDFLRDLVKNIPDVSAAEEKEMMSAENSPNSSRFSDMAVPPRRIVREDSNSSSSCDVRVQQIIQPPVTIKRKLSTEVDLSFKPQRTETVTSTILSADTAIDLSKKADEKPVVTANFYQETLLTDEVNTTQHRSVIQVNPTYSSPQPSTSSYTNMTPLEPVQRVDIPVPKPDRPVFYLDVSQNNKHTIASPKTPSTPILSVDKPVPPILKFDKAPTTPVLSISKPVTPILKIDFSKNLAQPEIKVLDKSVAGIVGVAKDNKNSVKHLQRQNSKTKELKKVEPKVPPQPVDIDHLNSGNLQIDEDYDT